MLFSKAQSWKEKKKPKDGVLRYTGTKENAVSIYSTQRGLQLKNLVLYVK